MLSFDWTRCFLIVTSIGMILSLGACTVKPLNATHNAPLAGQDAGTGSHTRVNMQTITVEPVANRVAQQVRNNLLFELNGGKPLPDGTHLVKMSVATSARSLAVESDSLSPTAAQTSITVNFQLVDTTNGDVVAFGKRRAVSSFDKTPQSFANERAEREAQNRAAKEVAVQIRLAIAQALAKS
jgi:LPS-assembly lipoprotein